MDPISRAFNSPTTAVIPSKVFNSAGVELIVVVPGSAAKRGINAVTALSPRSGILITWSAVGSTIVKVVS